MVIRSDVVLYGLIECEHDHDVESTVKGRRDMMLIKCVGW